MRISTALSKFLVFILCMALIPCPFSSAIAEDCFILNVDTLDMDQLNNNDYVAANLSAQTQGICVQKALGDASAPVRLSLTQMDTSTLLFDKDYGSVSGTFDSGVIYLPYVDNRTIPYLITLTAGDTTYAMPFMHLRPRLEYNGACTYGVRMHDLDSTLATDWLMGTMLDLNALRTHGSLNVPLCASNSYFIGQATFTLQNEALCTQLNFLTAASVQVNSLSLYVITDCASLNAADVQSMNLPAHSIGEWVDVSGAASALIYLPMQVSYDSSALETFGYDLTSGELQAQLALWSTNRSGAQAYVEPMPTPNELGGGFSENGGAADGITPWDNSAGFDDHAGWVDPGQQGGSSGWDSNVGWVDNGGQGSNVGWVENVGWVDYAATAAPQATVPAPVDSNGNAVVGVP
ncbi:MAG: hypothetical protein RR975_12070 [Clostridia bacterium]